MELKKYAHVAEMVRTLSGIRETAVGSDLSCEAVNPSRPPRNLRATHLLHSGDASKGPEISIRNPRELLLHAFHQLAADL